MACATRAVTSDPDTPSARSSTRNTRSASPSKARPMSAPCSTLDGPLRRGLRVLVLLGHGSDLAEARVLPHRLGPGQAELQAVPLRWVVAGGEHHAGNVEGPRREVQEIGGGKPEVHDVD